MARATRFVWVDSVGCRRDEVVAASRFFCAPRAHDSGCLCRIELACINQVNAYRLTTAASGPRRFAPFAAYASGAGPLLRSVKRQDAPPMELEEFRRRYFEAKRQCVELTVPLILEALPKIHVCFITLAPEDRVADFNGDERFREWNELFRKIGQTSAHEEDSMVNWLARDDFAPRSVELSIYGTTAVHTTFEFFVAGVFSKPPAGNSHLQEQPLAPWVPKEPRVPPGWRSVAESGRFSVNWHKKDAAHAA